MDEAEAQPQAVNPHSWRETSDEKTSCKQWTALEEMRHRLYDKVQVRPPARDMKLKMAMHQDLLRRFAIKASTKDGVDQERIKDRFNFVQKPRNILKKKRMKKLIPESHVECMHRQVDAYDLVKKIESKSFNITADPKIDFNITRAVSTLSCYDKSPREPPVEIGDGIVLESRPDVTQMLENVSIHEPYHINNGAIAKPLSTDLIDRTMSLGIGANVQNQAGSQVSLVNGSEINFSRGFREYCTNTVNPQLNVSLEKFLSELSRLQRNLYNRDNAKGRFRRRFYAGFREIEKRLSLNKLKLAIVAPNLDKRKGDNDELDKLVHRFIDSCKKYEVPVVFGLSRRKLGYLIHGKGFVSCIGVANYESLEEKLEEALKKVVENRNEFKILSGQADKMINMTILLTDDLLISERVKLLLKALVSY